MNGSDETGNEEDTMFVDRTNRRSQTDERALTTRIALSTVLVAAVLMTLAGDAQAMGLLFYAHENGDVRSLDMLTGGDSGISVPAWAFLGTPPIPASTRNIAYDASTDLLWYSASDNNVRSVNVTTLAAGPTIDDVNDAFYGAIRTIASDQATHRLYVSNSNGAVEVYNLATVTRMYTIPLSAFGYSEPNPGNRRHLAADGDGLLWYAAFDGAFKQFDTSQYNPRYTGREIPVAEQIGVNPGAERSFVAARWPSGSHFLYYAASDGTVRAANLETLTNVSLTFLASSFDGVTNPGALRSLAIDPTWTASGDPPSTPTGVSASDGQFTNIVRITWNGVSNVIAYALYRRNPGEADWTLWNSSLYDTTTDDTIPVPGVIHEYAVKACNQWGCSDYSPTDTGYAALLTPPSWINATQGVFEDRVRITWSPAPGATSYLLFIIPTEPGQLPYTATVVGTTYDHFGALPAGSVWTYSVSACPDSMQCSGDAGPAWGWTKSSMFSDGFESGDLSQWSWAQQ